MKIAVVVDSTASVQETDLSRFKNLSSIPLLVLFGDESFNDGTLSQEEYFAKTDKYYKETKMLPTTSQPSIGITLEHFENILKEYDHLIYITLSSKISGTYNNGVIASNEFEGRVTVIDSLITTDAQLSMALKACELIENNKELEEIIVEINKIKDNYTVELVVDDLAHLQRTGRISATSAVIGSMLKLKPILEFKDGEIVPKDKVRNINKAIKQVCDESLEKQLTKKDRVTICHAAGQEYVQKMKDYLLSKNSEIEVNITQLSPVIYTHTGPKTVGIIVIKDFYEQVK